MHSATVTNGAAARSRSTLSARSTRASRSTVFVSSRSCRSRRSRTILTTRYRRSNATWPPGVACAPGGLLKVLQMALHADDPFLASPPLPHEHLRIAVTARRVALLKLGYEPIPIVSGRKRPAINGWQDIRITISPDEDIISAWSETYPGALSTGIRTRYTPGFDIDIRDPD